MLVHCQHLGLGKMLVAHQSLKIKHNVEVAMPSHQQLLLKDCILLMEYIKLREIKHLRLLITLNNKSLTAQVHMEIKDAMEVSCLILSAILSNIHS
jgi:hypothetical protein